MKSVLLLVLIFVTGVLEFCTPAQPINLEISPAVKVAWPSIGGRYYQPTSSTDLQAWNPLGYPVQGTGQEVSIFAGASGPKMFFQVQEVTNVLSCALATTRIASEGVERIIQYDLRTGNLYFIGEPKHYLVQYVENGNNFWWCLMNEVRGSGLLEFLMEANPNEPQMRAEITSACAPGYNTSDYRLLKLTPLGSQTTWVNGAEGMKQISTTNLIHYLYFQRSTGKIYLAICNDGVVTANSGVLASAVYPDIAYKVRVPLETEQIRQLCSQFGDVILSDASLPIGNPQATTAPGQHWPQ